MSETFNISAASAYTKSGVKSTYPSISVNDANQIVEVHSQPDITNNLHYLVGKVDGPTYRFATNSGGAQKDPVSFGKGLFPSVSLKLSSNNNFVIVVFTDINRKLYQRRGTVNFETGVINWLADAEILTDTPTTKAGVYKASVATNPHGAVIIAFEDGDKTIHYKAGALNESDNTITWNNSVKLTPGVDPKISMNRGNSFVIVHKSESYDDLYYDIGTIDVNAIRQVTVNRLTSSSVEYLTYSINPAVAINISGKVIEVHGHNSGKDLFYIQGQINASILQFQPDKRYLNSDIHDADLTGNHPAVAITDAGVVIAAYESNSSRLYCSVSTIAERANWMKNFQSRSLRQLSIPGSHDAAMSVAQNCIRFGTSGNTQTQLQSISDQLNSGIRYLDIRPVFNGSNPIYAGHFGDDSTTGISGCDGQSMTDILTQVNSFITQDSNKTEVVILKFSHFLNLVTDRGFFLPKYNDPEKVLTSSTKQPLIDKLIKLMSEKISADNIYVHSGSTRISYNSLSTITAGKGKVIILFDIYELNDVKLNSNPDSGNVSFINSYGDLMPRVTADWVTYDNYSNTNDVDIMTSDTDTRGQIYKLMQPQNHTGDFFLCSWTLTLQGVGQNGNPLAYDIVELAQIANGVLAQDIRNSVDSNLITSELFPNVLYVDLADGFATDVCIWLNNQNIRGAAVAAKQAAETETADMV